MDTGVGMTTEFSRTLLIRLFDEVINRWSFGDLDQMFGPGFQVVPGEDNSLRGGEAARQFFLWLQSVFPDLHYTIDGRR